jgi:hypothetical protein
LIDLPKSSKFSTWEFKSALNRAVKQITTEKKEREDYKMYLARTSWSGEWSFLTAYSLPTTVPAAATRQ